MKHDLLADVFSVIKNTEAIGRKECVTPASKVIKGVLKSMQKHKYIGEFEYINDGKGGKFRIRLLGRINNANGPPCQENDVCCMLLSHRRNTFLNFSQGIIHGLVFPF